MTGPARRHSTASDQNGTPIVVGGVQQPRGIAWDGAPSSAWLVDRAGEAASLSAVVIAPPDPPRASVTYRIPGRGAGSVAVYDGGLLPAFSNDVLIASEEARCILRLRLPDGARSRRLTIERLLQDRVGPIRLIATAADGTIYFCTPESVGRVTAKR